MFIVDLSQVEGLKGEVKFRHIAPAVELAQRPGARLRAYVGGLGRVMLEKAGLRETSFGIWEVK